MEFAQLPGCLDHGRWSAVTIFGVSYVVAGWFALAILMSILLPLYFGLKFEWDPSSVTLDTSDHETPPTDDDSGAERGV